MTKPLKIEMAEIIRDTTHNLIITEDNELNNEIYFSRLKYFIGMLEGYRKDAYLDGIPKPKNKAEFISVRHFNTLSKETQKKMRADCLKNHKRAPIVTVGIGANIDNQKVLDNFDIILKEPGLMQLVHDGKADLTDEQISTLFRYSIETRFEELKNIYKSNWNKLRVNEKITITSLYFNHRKLAGGNTNLYKHITNYARTGDLLHLQQAIDEIENKSNPDKLTGIQNRRNAEATMLSSFYSKTYTKPNESPDSARITIAEIDKTVIPFNNSSFAKGVNSEYFVWRTKMDNSVRKEHLIREGKIFRKDNPADFMPGDEPNCRCEMEEVPDYIIIKDELKEKKAFELYLRKGIKHPILFRPPAQLS